MATAADVAAFRQIHRDVTALAYRDLLAFWRTLDPSDPIGTVRALEAFVPDLVQAYGQMGASVAADFYDDLRERSPAVAVAYQAYVGDAIPIEQIAASTRWAAGPLFTPRDDFAEVTLGRVVDITDRLIKQHGRDTVSENVRRDPARPRYARVPTGPDTCAFCLMLAARGPVYATEATASDKYHGHCDCVPTPVWNGDALPEDYPLDRYQDIYLRAKRDSDTGAAKGSDGVLAAMRKQQDIK